jgi:hypothetical protein
MEFVWDPILAKAGLWFRPWLEFAVPVRVFSLLVRPVFYIASEYLSIHKMDGLTKYLGGRKLTAWERQ